MCLSRVDHVEDGHGTARYVTGPQWTWREAALGNKKAETEREALDHALRRLAVAVENQRDPRYCHRLWSEFVRLRDLHRCVICNGPPPVFAHHLFRRSFLPQARFEVGNGITLCRSCHSTVHSAFNRRPDLSLPMDAEGGENIDMMVELMGRLIFDARERGILCDKYYFLSDQLLSVSKRVQGFDESLQFHGTRLEQAHEIWRRAPSPLMSAILTAVLGSLLKKSAPSDDDAESRDSRARSSP